MDGPTTGADRRPQVLFIGGMGRSGTTVVERLLNELPQAFAVGESIFLWKRGLRDGERCGCGRPLRSCPFWTAVGDVGFGGWDHVDAAELTALREAVDRTRRVPALLARRRTSALSAAQRRYLDHLVTVLVAAEQVASEMAGQPVVLLDSSKHLSSAALLTLDPRLDVRVLHLVRDPRGVAHSRMRTKRRPEAGNVVMSTVSPQNSASRWVTDNTGFEALAARGVPTLRLRYEDVTADPRAALLDVARFIGVETDAQDLAFLQGHTARFSTPMHSAAGNPVRFAGDELTIHADRSWQDHLAVGPRRLVTAIASPMLVRYRYPLRPGRPVALGPSS